MAKRISQGEKLSRPEVMGIASGIFFMAFFGAYWGYLSATYMSGAVQVVGFCLIGVVTLAYFVVAALILRYARSLPATVSPEEAAVGRRIGRWFGIIFGAEIALIVIASIVLSNLEASQYIAPVVALIVGVHFLPLAWLFQVPVYYFTGTVISVLALLAVVALLFGLPIGGSSPYNWSIFVGVGTTLILWVTAFSVARSGWRMISQKG